MIKPKKTAKCKECGEEFEKYATTDKFCSFDCKVKNIRYMSSRSKKRAKQERLYAKNRLQYLIKHPKCEVESCNRQATEIHHRKGRIGKLLTMIKHFLAVCSICHAYIENNPEWAKNKGYTETRIN